MSGLNFKEALAALERALPVLIFRVAFFVAGGVAVIVLFGALTLVSHLKGGLHPAFLFWAIPLIVLFALAMGWVLERFLLYRHQAAMLWLFSQPPGSAALGMETVLRRASVIATDSSAWAEWIWRLRRFFAVVRRGESFMLSGDHCPAVGRLTSGSLSQAVLAVAYARPSGSPNESVKEAVALCLRHGAVSQDLARGWRRFSWAALLLLFALIALPNWFFFRSAGAPITVGIALAVAIACLLHRAFVLPMVLAGMSAALLAATSGHEPDKALLAKIAPLLTP